jgi:photosystem II stability/assembly factor-like uncharacterized protein
VIDEHMKLVLASLLSLSAIMNAQWQKVDVATTAGFRGLNVVSEKIIWASGTEGTVIRSVDAGKTWSAMTVPGAEKLDFRGIKAFDGNTAVIISSGPAEKGEAKIFRTTDGGKSWKQVFEEKRAGIFFDAVAFWDKQNGIVLSDPVDGKFALFITDDGGLTWKQLTAANLPAALPKEGGFAASNSCLVVEGTHNVWFATGGASVARVFHSSDRGKTWQVAETPMHPRNASSGIFSLAFRDAKNGIAAGGDYQKPEGSDLPNIMRTNDGGKTWQAARPTNPAGLYLSSVIYSGRIGEKAAISAAGTAGILRSDDGGNWRIESTEPINALLIGKELDLWAVGPKGIVLKNTAR